MESGEFELYRNKKGETHYIDPISDNKFNHKEELTREKIYSYIGKKLEINEENKHVLTN